MKIAGIVLGGLVLMLGLTWLVQGNDFFMYQFWAPKYEQVRRTTYEQTHSYRQGMVQELQNMQFEYEQADEDHKAALRSLILHRAADAPEGTLTPDLEKFIEKLKEQEQ